MNRRQRRSSTPQIKLPEILVKEYGRLAIGATIGFKAFGICWKDKYCWTNVFGFEKLK